MATDQDIIDELIKQTESGELKWEARTEGRGFWHFICDEIHFYVSLSGEVEAGSESLGKSAALLEMLKNLLPLDAALKSARDETLDRALRCLTEKGK